MSLYIIGDLHLSLEPGTDKPMDIFGSRWFNHAERISENWKKVVGEDDTVIIAGDISWALRLEGAKFDLDFVDALPGHKVILKGNHDLWWQSISKMKKMYENIKFLQNDFHYADGKYICGTRGWITPDDDDFTEDDEKVYRRELIRLEMSLKSAVEDKEARIKAGDESAADDEIIGVLHYPPVSKFQSISGIQEMFRQYGVKRVYYGHVHGEEAFAGAIRGIYHDVEYNLISADYLNCRLYKIQ